ncbi:Ig-like domain repeat protein [Nocardia neocaledoniensis]|uniref:Ig-like domain repeat protein n=1 Tax=Nocardia neocaledoniensis TaxID=236511 RepID=UPI0024582510|nr:Ig-like domain repeat protein [Nocardia neocaledoniensis]
MSFTLTRRAGVGLTTFGAVAAAAVLVAPQASALVQSIAVSGSTHYVDTAYTVTADVTATSFLFKVTFTDNGTQIGEPVSVSNGKATITWTPKTTGTHEIKAVQELVSSKTITVNVVPKPTNPGPGDGDSGSGGLGGLLDALTGSAG